VDAVAAFDRLDMTSRVEDEDLVTVEVPGYRVDIEREVDLIEEVVRVQGYDLVGSTVPPVRQVGGVPAAYGFRAQLRGSLRRSGLREVRLLSFASQGDVEMAEADGPIRITNPLQADESFLRTRLLPGVLRAVQRNVYRHVRGVALFEVGTVFRMKEGAPDERTSLAVAMTGPASQSWAQPPRPFDFFDAKGALEAVLEDAGVRGWSMGPPAGWPFHPSRSATILSDAEVLGVVGEIHPSLVERLDLGGRVAAAEVDVQALMAHASSEIEVRDVPRFPPVRRDLAFVLDATVPAAPVQVALLEAGGDVIEACLLFDVFSGTPLPEGKKSLAFSLDLRAPDRTLTDEEADAVVRRIAGRLASEFGAELRAI